MKKFFGYLLMAAMIASCSSTVEPTNDAESGMLVASATTDNVTLDIYADEALRVGYNPLRIRVRNGADIIRNADISIAPMMDMGTMQHSSPMEQPDAVNANGSCDAGVIFIMAGTKDQWMLQCTATVNGVDHHLDIPIDVAPSDLCKVLKNGMQRTVVTMVTNKWKVGMNDVDLILHRSMDGHDFQPVADAHLAMDPTMPSMGHGSAGNVAPTPVANGWYRGKVNLTMSGDWSIQVRHVENDVDMFSVDFNIVVP